jgi:hypothetical protein
MNSKPNFSLLPNEVLVKIFGYSSFDDLFNIQGACPKFRKLVWNLKREEMERDWRIKYAKYQKFDTEISTINAIKSIASMARPENKNYSLRGFFMGDDFWYKFSLSIPNVIDYVFHGDSLDGYSQDRLVLWNMVFNEHISVYSFYYNKEENEFTPNP